MKKTLNALFALLLALAMIFTFASCSDDDDDDDEVNIAGNTYVVSQEKEVETFTDGSTRTTTITMPSPTQLRIVSDIIDKTSGQASTSKVDMTITKGSSKPTFKTFIIDGVSYINDSAAINSFLTTSGFDAIDDDMWSDMTGTFTNRITLSTDGTWSGTIAGGSATGTYKIDSGNSKIIVSTDGEADTYDVGYSNGGKTLTLTEEEYDETEGMRSVYTMTFSRQ